MAENKMFQEALIAVRKGDRVRARDLLTRLLKTEPANSEYWLWMSAVVETIKERVYCLQEVLKRDPGNMTARRGLGMLGILPRDQVVTGSNPFQRRNWQAKLVDVDTSATKESGSKLVRRIGFLAGGVVVLVVIFIIVAVSSRWYNPTVGQLRRTGVPITARPTATMMPTFTPVVRSATPTFIGPTPLWMFLSATYTPTPLYINTPHPRIEAYRSALRAYQRGSYPEMLTFMQQVLSNDPAAVDAAYFIGEAYRLEQKYSLAIQAYNKAIQIDPNFAPIYLGIARATLASDPTADVTDQLDKAIELDPNLAEAYLERAAFLIDRDKAESAMEDVNKAFSLLPDSPLVYMLRAQVYVALGQPDKALADAKKANDLDMTLLDSYLVLAQAYQAVGRMTDSVKSLEVYLRYVTDDPRPYLMLANAYIAAGQNDLALQTVNKVFKLDRWNYKAYLLRANLYTSQKDYKKALDDYETILDMNPKIYDAGMGRGITLYQLGYFGDAYLQLEKMAAASDTDKRKAVLYYWRALSLEGLKDFKTASKDWAAILALPADTVPADFLKTARAHLDAYYTATPTLTPVPSLTFTPTKRVTATKTVVPSKTLTPTKTPKVSPTPTPTQTPQGAGTGTPTGTVMPAASSTTTPTPTQKSPSTTPSPQGSVTPTPTPTP